MKKMKKKGPQNAQKTRKKDTKLKKNFCVFLCVRMMWALYP